MHGLVQTLESWIGHYGYVIVFVTILLEDFGLPAPGETVLISAALVAAKGELNIFLLLLAGWIGAVIGDNIGYAIGRFGGRALVLRFGRYVLVNEKRLSRAEDFFHAHGPIVVVIARFIEILRQLNGIMAGILAMPWWKFFSFNAIGAFLWVVFWGTLFYLAGRQAFRVLSLVNRYWWILPALGTLGLLGLAVRFFLRRRHAGEQRPRS
ncbi:MAG: DedA family protein [Spirochaetia bacterium]|jgi:membrane protein DedA with SNARE-associated domain